MEGEKILMAAGLGAAVVVGAFVFWGPSGSSRLRKRRGQIAGLHNFGRTCFLNTLLQALAACPQFMSWLQLHNGVDKKSLITSLLSTLEVINGTHPSLRGDPYSPGSVIRALNTLGWVIPPDDEHDAHELLHVMLASLEEEAIRPTKLVGCLSDALGDCKGVVECQRPSSAMLSDFLNTEYDESTNLNLMRQVRSEAHTPDSPSSVCDENEEVASIMEKDIQMSPNLSLLGRQSRPRTMQQYDPADLINKRNSMSCRSLERLSRGPGRVSIWSDRGPTQVPHPFQGAMGSQIICSSCGHKSPVRYDKFDSISLNLPEQRRTGLSLGHLLSEYIASENLTDVTCESCNETTIHTKSLTFAKLPACLCIHVQRTRWLPTGQVTKRQDYLHFPESLSMAPYSFVQPHLNSQASTPWGSTISLFSSSVPTNGEFSSFGGGNGGVVGGGPLSGFGFGSMFPKNLYRLLAVVVHSGEANSGHFVTYRRGALRNSHRWFYTSDTIVKEVSIDEVLSIPAYMLFYDRGPQKIGIK